MDENKPASSEAGRHVLPTQQLAGWLFKFYAEINSLVFGQLESRIT